MEGVQPGAALHGGFSCGPFLREGGTRGLGLRFEERALEWEIGVRLLPARHPALLGHPVNPPRPTPMREAQVFGAYSVAHPAAASIRRQCFSCDHPFVTRARDLGLLP